MTGARAAASENCAELRAPKNCAANCAAHLALADGAHVRIVEQMPAAATARGGGATAPLASGLPGFVKPHMSHSASAPLFLKVQRGQSQSSAFLGASVVRSAEFCTEFIDSSPLLGGGLYDWAAAA